VSGSSKSGGWLDTLARWSVRGSDAGGAPGPGRGSAGPVGTTRRTALRGAAGAGALAVFAPLRLLQPALAVAASSTALSECISASSEAAFEDSEKCRETPLSDYLQASKHIDSAKQALKQAKTAAERKRLEGVIRYQRRLAREALRDLGFCNKSFLSDRAEGEVRCEKAHPPGGEETESSGNGGNGGCEQGYLLCADYCCNTNNAYCQGCNGKVVCCRIEADCCPSGS
jgi:hypothetical protein